MNDPVRRNPPGQKGFRVVLLSSLFVCQQWIENEEKMSAILPHFLASLAATISCHPQSLTLHRLNVQTNEEINPSRGCDDEEPQPLVAD